MYLIPIYSTIQPNTYWNKSEELLFSDQTQTKIRYKYIMSVAIPLSIITLFLTKLTLRTSG